MKEDDEFSLEQLAYIWNIPVYEVRTFFKKQYKDIEPLQYRKDGRTHYYIKKNEFERFENALEAAGNGKKKLSSRIPMAKKAAKKLAPKQKQTEKKAAEQKPAIKHRKETLKHFLMKHKKSN